MLTTPGDQLRKPRIAAIGRPTLIARASNTSGIAKRPAIYVVRTQGQHQHLEADEHEQDRIQRLVDQLPKIVQALLGRLRHGAVPTLVADDQTGHDNGDWCREAEVLGGGIAAAGERQRDQHLHLVIVYAA